MLGGLLHMAGQIGLDPPTMQLVPGGLQAQLLRYEQAAMPVLLFTVLSTVKETGKAQIVGQSQVMFQSALGY